MTLTTGLRGIKHYNEVHVYIVYIVTITLISGHFYKVGNLHYDTAMCVPF